MATYAIALGGFMALMLLVIGMEEGGGDLSAAAVPLTETVVLLSQGVGFHTTSVTVTIMPLLLTLLLIAVIRQFARKLCVQGWAYGSGVLLWMVMNLAFINGVSVGLVDTAWMAVLKSALVFSIGFAWAALPGSSLMTMVRARWMRYVREDVRHVLAVGMHLAWVVLGVYVCVGLLTVIAWIALGYETVGKLFVLSGMHVGSRVFTSIAALAWLPNVVIWAVSWLFGAGFHIGQLATCTLWSGQASDLPPLPVFGLLPAPVDNELVRMMVLSIPVVVGCVAGLVSIVWSKGMALRVSQANERPNTMELVVCMVCTAGAFCLTSGIVAVCSTAVYALSNGSLGEHRLADVGVDIVAAAQSTGRPTALGLLCAWLVAVVGVAAIFAIRWCAMRVRGVTPSTDDGDSTADNDANQTSATQISEQESAHSGTAVPQSRQEPHTQKEEQGDHHEPTDS